MRALSPLHRALRLFCALLLAAGLIACQSGEEGSGETSAPPVVEVTAKDYAFQALDSIRAGWTKFRLTNRGKHVHMLELARLPDRASFGDFREWASTVDSLRAQLEAGAIDSTEMEEAIKRNRPNLGDLEWAGGFGLLSPGRTSRLSLKLEPGTYLMLCAVKGTEGEVHLRRGMWKKLTVTEQASGARSPQADMEMRVADYQIETSGEMGSGKQTVAIHFEGRPESPDNPFQTVDLIPVQQKGDVDRVVKWLADGYRTSAPAEFLGGSVEVPAPATVYLTLDLEPGRYAWVSRASQAKGMVQTFTVP